MKKIIKHLSIAILTGISIPFGAILTFKADGLIYEPTNSFYIFTFLLGAVLGGGTSILSEKNGPLDNWKTWSALAHNKNLSIFILIFTFGPIVVKAAKLVNIEEHLTPIFYAYWLCGLSLLIFISLFRLISPRVYGYQTFEQFKSEANSIVEFREEAKIALKSINKREKANKLNNSERPFLYQDKVLLNRVIKGKDVNLEDVYAVLKHRFSYHNDAGRNVVSFFLLIPTYVLPIVFLANIALVFNQAYINISNKGSLLKILFGA